MLILRIVYQRKNQVDTFAKSRCQLQNRVSIRFVLWVVSLDLFDLFFYEFISHNVVTSHLGHQEHYLLNLVADIFLLVLKVSVYLFKHLLLEHFSFSLILLDLLNLHVLFVESLLDSVNFRCELFNLFGNLRRNFCTLITRSFSSRVCFDSLEFCFNTFCEVGQLLFHLWFGLLDSSLKFRNIFLYFHAELIYFLVYFIHCWWVHFTAVFLVFHELRSVRCKLVLNFHLDKINFLSEEVFSLLSWFLKFANFFIQSFFYFKKLFGESYELNLGLIFGLLIDLFNFLDHLPTGPLDFLLNVLNLLIESL